MHELDIGHGLKYERGIKQSSNQTEKALNLIFWILEEGLRERNEASI